MTLHNVLIIAEQILVGLIGVLFIAALGAILLFDLWFMRLLGLWI